MQPFTFFISYRRKDTAPIALLLKSEIEKRIQFVRVSVDIEDIKIGENFPDRIKNLIDGAHATIVLIGKNWMPMNNTSSLLIKEVDWVEHEIKYSKMAPLAFLDTNKFELVEREILPIFADCDKNFNQFYISDNLGFLNKLHSEYIDYAGWPTAIGPLIDRIAVKLNLKKRPDADEYPKPDLSKARTQPLSDYELTQILKYDDYEGWYIDNFGNSEVRYLTKIFRFRNFNVATKFMELVSSHCQILDHHPEWRNVFNHVTVSLTTWDAHRRITIYDMNLALFMNMAAKEINKR